MSDIHCRVPEKAIIKKRKNYIIFFNHLPRWTFPSFLDPFVPPRWCSSIARIHGLRSPRPAAPGERRGRYRRRGARWDQRRGRTSRAVLQQPLWFRRSGAACSPTAAEHHWPVPEPHAGVWWRLRVDQDGGLCSVSDFAAGAVRDLDFDWVLGNQAGFGGVEG